MACFHGKNTCVVTSNDMRRFGCLIYLTKKKEIAAVGRMIPFPKESDFVAGKQKVVNHLKPNNMVHDGVVIEEEEEDDDDLIMESNIVVSRKCALGGSRVKLPTRMEGCGHLSFFDRDNFLVWLPA